MVGCPAAAGRACRSGSQRRHRPGWPSVDLDAPATPIATQTKEQYVAAIERSKQYIRDGDVFQVVISQRFDHEITAHPDRRLPRAAHAEPEPVHVPAVSLETTTGEPYSIVGSSPEALVKVQHDRVYSHPIAGSKPRGATPEEDVDLAEELQQDQKELAEHLMLVDLARNDLAKVCVPGTVEVTEFLQVERFSHIMHLVSSVEGDLRPEANAVDVFRATFPAGTLSGAPKPRALEIIDELEPWQRGVYGEWWGTSTSPGTPTSRSRSARRPSSAASRGCRRAPGLVADSDPDTEHAESQHKAAAPLRAIAVANAMRRV